MHHHATVGILALALALFGCDKEKDDGEESETTGSVTTDDQPDGSDDGGDGGGDDGVPDCDGDNCKPAIQLTQASCIAKGDYWYDQTDVEQTDKDGFDDLKPTCHNDFRESCPEDGSVIWAYSTDGGGTLISDDVTNGYYYQSYSDLTNVFSTIRCFQGGFGTLSLNIPDNKLTALDVSVNPEIVWLDVSWNDGLTKIILPKNTANLEFLDVSHTDYNPAALPLMAGLTSLNVRNLSIVTLDLSKTPKLQSLDVSNTGVTSLDLTATPELYDLNIGSTAIDIASLGLEDTNVVYLMIHDMGLADLSGVPDTLLGLMASSNNFGALDLSGFPNLEQFYCFYCNITSVTLPVGSALTTLSLWNNDLAAVDLTNAGQLTSLDLSSNQLTTIDLTATPLVQSLDLSFNALTSIDLSGSVALQDLYLYNNALTSIDLTTNTQLSYLDLSDNDLTYDGTTTWLDLSNQALLTRLSLTGNDNLTLRFEQGVSFHEDYLTGLSSELAIESDKWTNAEGPDQPAWFEHGDDPYTYYNADAN